MNNVKCSPITVANSGDGKRLVQITAQLQVLTPLLSAMLLPVFWCNTIKGRKLNVEVFVEKQNVSIS